MRKFLIAEINFLRTVEQLCDVPKRILSKLFSWLKLRTFKRGHILFRENDPVDYAYIIKEGECHIDKYIYDNKYTKDEERQVLEKSFTAVSKFNSNFVKAQGVHPVSSIKV